MLPPPCLQENELFVGRVAQLGFAAGMLRAAARQAAGRVRPALLLLQAMAMEDPHAHLPACLSPLPFCCAALIGEAITGQGILGQIGIETGLPLSQTEPLLLGFIAFTLFAAVNEGSGKFVDEK